MFPSFSRALMDLTSSPSMSAPKAWTVSNIIWEEDTLRLSAESSARHHFTIPDILLDYGLLIVGQKIGTRGNQVTKQVAVRPGIFHQTNRASIFSVPTAISVVTVKPLPRFSAAASVVL